MTFPLFTKGPVKGNDKQFAYQHLTTRGPRDGEVQWNFEKFLVNKEGKVVGRYRSAVEPEDADLQKEIEALL